MGDYDEPYYCSPAYGSGDYMFEGSDAEETPKEILAKRARYEEQAARIKNGHRPIIMSASLRGPFERESGWENPWRYRPRRIPKTKKEQDWWKPGSENMMFTRENVLKRAADHGLGWMTPAAALEWCKASAEAEAEGETEPNSMEMHMFSEDGTLRRGAVCIKVQLSTEVKDQPRQVESLGEPTQSTADTGSTRNSFTRGTKRSHSSKWLKGSFASKRARWDSPPIPSPTPLAGIQRGTGSRSNSPPAFNPTSHLSSKGSSRLAQISHLSMSGSPQRVDQFPVDVSIRKSESGTHQSRRTSSAGSTALSAKDRVGGGDELKKLNESVSAISFRYSSPVRSGAPGTALNAISLVSSDSETDSETKQVIPSARQTGTPSLSRTLKSKSRKSFHASPSNKITMAEDNKALGGNSFVTEVAPSCRDLEKFQFRKKRKIYHENVQDPRTGSSATKSKAKPPLVEATTTVRSNPTISCQVEQLEDSEDWETTIDLTDKNGAESSMSVLKSSRRTIRSILQSASLGSADLPDDDGDDEWETTIGEQGYLHSIKATSESKEVLSPGAMAVAEESPIRVQIAEESTTPPKSVCSSSSWDMMEVDASSTFRQGMANSPAKSIHARQPTYQENSITPAPVLLGSCGTTTEPTIPQVSSPTMAPPSQSSHQPCLTNPEKSSGVSLCGPASQPEATVEHLLAGANSPTADENIDQNEISTQSANTTPTRILQTTNLLSSSVAVTITKDRERRFSSAEVSMKGKSQDLIKSLERQSYDSYDQPKEDEDQDEMSQIQHALSQNRPGSSQDDSSASEDVGENTEPEEEYPVQEQPIQSQSSGPGNSSKNFENLSEDILISEETPKARTSTASRQDDLALTSIDDVVIRNEEYVEVTPTSQHVLSRPVSEPQSPWADDNTLPSISERVQEMAHVGAATLYRKDEEPISTDWEQFERSLLAKHNNITTFENFVTPIKSPKMRMAQTNKSIRSQEDVTIINPWTSSMKKAGPNKAKKRVSFGFALAAEEEEESTASQNPVIELPTKGSSPSQIDPVDDGNPRPRPILVFNHPKGGEAPQRSFKRMLPDKSASQLNSSPAPVEAMAEAFITADQEAPMHRAQARPANSILQSPRMVMGCSSPWRDDASKVAAGHSFSGAHRDSFPVDDFMNDFDLAGAIGEATDFLEDWSVEADLKKSRLAAATEIESNGMKRRRLFGIS